MKKRNNLLLSFICIMLIVLIYVCNIDNIPNNLIIYEEDIPQIDTLFGIDIKTKKVINTDIKSGEEIQQTISNNDEMVKLNVNLFGIKVKEISASLIDEIEVIPLGNLVGMKLYTKGILVVGMSEIYGKDNEAYKPYENSGIREGDSIIKINDKEVTSTEELIECINSSNGEDIKITYIHNNDTLETNITPIEVEKNKYKIGLWVRDTAAGLGTATFYDPKTNNIAALGHGIQDIDTEELLNTLSGELTTTDIVSIQKGEQGEAGKIQGTLEEQEILGNITKNTYYGVYGKVINLDKFKNKEAIKVATRKEIQIGDAEILCELSNNEIKSYKVKIKKIYINNNSNNKSMLLEITDEELIEKTGGIIQGMSGSPIIQNGKLIGALTHVLVQNPKEGYGVFADMMIKQMD